jgi:hypothetical protein
MIQWCGTAMFIALEFDFWLFVVPFDRMRNQLEGEWLPRFSPSGASLAFAPVCLLACILRWKKYGRKSTAHLSQ